jgi:hypothetical protein
VGRQANNSFNDTESCRVEDVDIVHGLKIGKHDLSRLKINTGASKEEIAPDSWREINMRPMGLMACL